MEVGGEDAGRITMELREDVVPKTTENFKGMFKFERHLSRVICLFDPHLR